jgi:hypothetical protein
VKGSWDNHINTNHSDVISATSPRFVHLFKYVALVIWISIELMFVKNVMKNLNSHDILLYCVVDGNDIETYDDNDNGWSGDAKSDDEEENFDTKYSLESFTSIHK